MKCPLNETHWDRIKDMLPGKKGDSGAKARDNRAFIEVVVWIARTGAHETEHRLTKINHPCDGMRTDENRQ